MHTYNRIHCLAISPKSNQIAIANIVLKTNKEQRKSVLKTYGSTNRKKTYDGVINDIQFSNDGDSLLIANLNGTIHLWNTVTGKGQKLFQHDAAVTCAIFSPDMKQIIFGDHSGHVTVWHRKKKKLSAFLRKHTTHITKLVFTANNIIASASKDKTILLWDFTTKKVIHIFKGHSGAINCLAVNTNQILASGSDDGTIRLWNLKTKRHFHTIVRHNSPVNALQFTADGNTIVSGSADGGVGFWDLRVDSKWLISSQLELRKILQKVTGHYLDGNTLMPNSK